MATTTISTCNLWYSAWSGIFYVNPPAGWTLAEASTLHCTRWSMTTTGTQLIDDAAPIQVDILNSNLDVTVTNVVDVQDTSTGAQLVQIDPFTYPIPVVNQGTAPQEVIFTGGTLQIDSVDLDISEETATDLLNIGTYTGTHLLYTFYYFALLALLTYVIVRFIYKRI